ncbi:MAG TPA: DNA helicase UvrD [Planctomycetes bacterium]|nr:DNA helicase UvrD [Planctomycetota bacterium]
MTVAAPEMLVDLHVHSRYSRACSRAITPGAIALWARLKGLAVVGTGDFTHPEWLAELEAQLLEDGRGLLSLSPAASEALAAAAPPSCRGDPRFILTTEVCAIYTAAGRTRRIHHIIAVPDFASARRCNEALAHFGNLAADGRPILKADSKRILQIALACGPGAFLVPAHIWTPWFSLLGARSGFDSLSECFGDLSPEVFAVETGLSSDPPMNRRLSALDRITLVSGSDAHSPAKLGRECTVLRCDRSFGAIRRALADGDGYAGTIEFFPEEGKYHFDGHRRCGVRMRPGRARRARGICPACGKAVTQGVLHRVEVLADRPAGALPPGAHVFERLVPLEEIIAEALGAGVATRGVRRAYMGLIALLGPELDVLRHAPIDAIDRAGPAAVGTAVRRMRRGEIAVEPGYDGEYGTIRLLPERRRPRS